MYIYTHICIYVYIHTNKHIYIYIYIYGARAARLLSPADAVAFSTTIPHSWAKRLVKLLPLSQGVGFLKIRGLAETQTPEVPSMKSRRGIGCSIA